MFPGHWTTNIKFNLQKADEWEIVSNETVRVRTPRDLGELLVFSRRTTLRFSLTLRRRAGFQAYLLSVPCVVLGALSILVFVLPPERPDRHAIGQYSTAKLSRCVVSESGNSHERRSLK